MKRNHLYAILSMFVVAGILGTGWFYYKDFLNQGQAPDKGTQILNELETKGLPADVEFKALNGTVTKFADYKGKMVLLSFWASWCEPCIQEFPSMLKLIEHFKGEIILLAVSADYEESDLLAFLKAFKALDKPNVTVVWDKARKISEHFGTVSLPETYIIGRDGKIIRKVVGSEDWAGPAPIAFFESLLKNP